MKSRKRTHIVRPFKVNSRDSAYQIEFAVQIPKKREHVPLFFDLRREKVSARELSDDFGTAYGSFLLVGETTVSRQPFDRYTFIL